jgi:hypothetical protein
VNLIENTVQQNKGQYVAAYPGVSVTVYLTGTNTLASLYEVDGVTPKTNPLTTDENGFYIARTPASVIDIVLSKDGTELLRMPGIAYGGFDGSNVTITGGTIDGVVIGGSAPAAGHFTDIDYSGELSGDGA